MSTPSGRLVAMQVRHTHTLPSSGARMPARSGRRLAYSVKKFQRTMSFRLESRPSVNTARSA
ncbi:hypothetical protein EBR56_01150, partial [bacterium]|nr:hypothetical protein [bacterium]